jgi:uncharacterized repeat protein (TIGR02543 family)
MFENDENLATVTVASAAKITTVGSLAFCGCASIKSTSSFDYVELGKTLTSAGKYAFRFAGRYEGKDETSKEPTVSTSLSVSKANTAYYWPTSTSYKGNEANGLAKVTMSVSASSSKSEAGQDYIFIVDTTSTMKTTYNGTSKMDVAKEAIEYFADTIISGNASNRIAIVTFDSNIYCSTDFTNDTMLIEDRISKIGSSGGNTTGYKMQSSVSGVDYYNAIINAEKVIQMRAQDTTSESSGYTLGGLGDANRNVYAIFVSGGTPTSNATYVSSAAQLLKGTVDDIWSIGICCSEASADTSYLKLLNTNSSYFKDVSSSTALSSLKTLFDNVKLYTTASICGSTLKLTSSYNSTYWEPYSSSTYKWTSGVTQSGSTMYVNIGTYSSDLGKYVYAGSGSYTYYLKLKDSYKQSLSSYYNSNTSSNSVTAATSASLSYTIYGGVSDGTSRTKSYSNSTKLEWNTRSLTLDVGDGTLDSGTETTYSKTFGSTVTLPTPTAPDGYTFTSWTLSRDTSKSETVTTDIGTLSDDTYTFGLTSAVATANYELAGSLITYEGNGSDGGSMDIVRKADGATLTIPDCTFTKTDYKFVGWNTSANGTGKDYAVGDTYSTDADLTLYAQWKLDVAGYTVNHYKQNADGTYPSTPTDTQTVKTEQNITVTPAVKSYTGFVSPEAQEVEIGEEVVTVNYYYERESYSLTVQPNGGIWNDTSEDSLFTMRYGETKTIASPTREGYTFKNWSLVNGSYSGTTFTMGTDNATLTANWTVNKYDVIYVDVIGSVDGEVLNTYDAVRTDYGTTVDGADKGSDTTANAYYNGYSLLSTTSAVVGVNGATVYRIFGSATFSITGKVIWIDKNNSYLSRPTNITVSLLQNGKVIDMITGLTTGESNDFAFNDLPKFDEQGNEYTYEVVQCDIRSQNHPEDIYITTKDDTTINIIIFNNKLTNNVITSGEEGDGESGEDGTGSGSGNNNGSEDTVETISGYSVKCNIVWSDYDDSIGARPEDVLLTLYQNDEEYKTVTVKGSSYTFGNLPKYDCDEDGTILDTYEYKVVETINSKVVTLENDQYKEIDAYTVSYVPASVNSKNGAAQVVITNTIADMEGFISVKPYNNAITIRTDSDIDSDIVLRQVMTSFVNGEVDYTDDYSGIYYNMEIGDIEETISKLLTGKYEIEVTNPLLILESAVISDNEGVSITREGNSYYIIIEEGAEDATASIDITFKENEVKHIGYQSGRGISGNDDAYATITYWKPKK